MTLFILSHKLELNINVQVHAASGNPTTHATPHATHEFHSSVNELAAPELVAAAIAEDEDEAGEEVDTTCEVIDGEEDECAAVLEVDTAPPVLNVASPVAALVVFASPVVAVSVEADMPVVLIGPPGLSEVRIGSGFPVKWAVSRTHVPSLQVYPA